MSHNLLTAFGSLRKRSLVELSSPGYFTLQPVIMEYLTNKIIDQVFTEVQAETPNMLANYALMKAQTPEYVRETQVRLILSPLAELLFSNIGREELEKKLKRVFATIRRSRATQNDYAAGNLCNLMIQMHFDLRDYDFSYLRLRQVYFRDVSLLGANFSHAHFIQPVFMENFGSVLTVALSPTSELVAAGTTDGEIRLWQTISGTLLRTCQGHTDRVWSVAFSPDGKTLASSSEDQTIRLWNANSGECLNTLHGHTERVRSVIFSSDGRLLASGSENHNIRLWDVNNGQCLQTLQTYTDRIWSIDFSRNGSIIASGSMDQTVRFWDVNQKQTMK